MIRIKDLRVDYDDLCAVKDLSLEVGPGEVCGLIGPNGAGKTTTMRAMLGLLEPTYGEIEVMRRGRPRAAQGRLPDRRLHARLPARLRGPHGLGVPRPVRRQLRARIRSQRRHAVADHLDMVGLTEKREAMVGELSRGMRQRMMLAKTLIPNPHVLLLDEPASGIDPQGRIELKNILRRLAEEKKTVLISSHILAEMNEFCTSVVIMEKGQDRRRRADRRGQPAGHGRLVPHGRGAGRGRAVPVDRRRRRPGRRDRAQGQQHLRVPLPRRRRRPPASCWRPWCSRACASPGSPASATTSKTCSSRSDPRSSRDVGPHPRLDRQPDPRQARPVEAAHAAVAQLADRRGAVNLCIAYAGYELDCYQTGIAAG